METVGLLIKAHLMSNFFFFHCCTFGNIQRKKSQKIYSGYWKL